MRGKKESIRREKGLGARTPEGETIKATPRGRHPRPENPPSRPAGRGGPKAAAPRAARAKRRTVRDNNAP